MCVGVTLGGGGVIAGGVIWGVEGWCNVNYLNTIATRYS